MKEPSYYKQKDIVFDCDDAGTHSKVFNIEDDYKCLSRIPVRSKYLASCIIPIYNVGRYLEQAVESIINQTIGFVAYVQLILVNDGSTDNSEEICQHYQAKYPENIIYISQKNMGVSAARNCGLKYAAGEFITFLDGDDKLDIFHLEKGIQFLREHDVPLVSFPIQYFGNGIDKKEHALNYKYEECRVINLKEDYNYPQIMVHVAVIRRSEIDGLRFVPELKYYEDAVFMHQLLIRRMKYGVSNEAVYYYRQRESRDSAVQKAKKSPEWYQCLIPFTSLIMEQSLEEWGYITRFTQYTFMYLLQWYGFRELPKSMEGLISRNELLCFIGQALQQVEDDIISQMTGLTGWQKFFLLKLKYNEVCLDETSEEIPYFHIKGNRVEQLRPDLWITSVEDEEDKICIRGYFIISSFENMQLTAFYQGCFRECSYVENRIKDVHFLGKEVHKALVFEFIFDYNTHVPLKGDQDFHRNSSNQNCKMKFNAKEEGKIEFFIRLPSGDLYPVRLKYADQCGLNHRKHSFYGGSHFVIKKTDHEYQLYVMERKKADIKEMLRLYLTENFAEEKYGKDIALVQLYLMIYPFMKDRKIWLIMDRSGKADDNAEYFFRYCADIQDGIDKYFVIDGSSPDYKRLEKSGNVIAFGSDTHKLLSLFADKFISSFFEFSFRYPFGDSMQQHIFKGLVKSKFIYLQHGILKDDLSVLLNKWNRNISYICTASEFENRELTSPYYGYDKRDIIFTGAPRYDCLYDNRKKKLLIMPTWRRELSKEADVFNPEFINSRYCTEISRLLCDESLIQEAKQLGYEIIFRPHPRTYIQLQDFEMDEYVVVPPLEVRNADLFSEGALLVTDYSSVMFDFAYLKKPVLYYQFEEHHWEEGYFDYKTMGFGETAAEHEEIVRLLISYMKEGCSMRDVYRKRAESFFKYYDHDNCQRLYEAVKGIK